MHRAQQPGGAGEQAVHEPDRGRGAGQRLQQRHHPVGGQEVHDHQVHRERGQARAVTDRTRPRPLGAGRGGGPPAPTRHLVLVVLRDPHGHLRDLMLLVGVDHTEIERVGQIGAAAAASGREPVAPLVRVVDERQMRARRAGLLAPRPSALTMSLLLRHRRLTRVAIARGRT